jgi:hypothetical protein
MRKPRYDLVQAQNATIQISRGCVDRANQILDTDPNEVRRYITDLMRCLEPADFAHTELMPQRVGKPRFGDVYGKANDEALWFVKFEFDGSTTTVMMSCHEAEHPIELADGRTLKKRP